LASSAIFASLSSSALRAASSALALSASAFILSASALAFASSAACCSANFLEMLELPNALFFALTEDLSHAYWIWGKDVFAYKLVEVKKENFHEAYYDVPKSLFKYVKL